METVRANAPVKDRPAATGVAAKSSGAATKPPMGWWNLLKKTASEWSEQKAPRLSAALSLYTILSLAPLLVITIKVVAVFFGKDAAEGQVKGQLIGLMGANAAQAIQDMIQRGNQHGEGVMATIISSVILVFSATGVFGELQDSMNTIWEVKPRPNQGIWGLIRNRLLSLAMVFGIAFLLLVSLFVSTLVTTVATKIAGDVAWLAFVVDLFISLGVVTLLLAAIFKFLPDVKTQWRDVWLGAFATAALFTIGKYALAIYFKKGSTVSAFGAAGSLVAVLLWVYYSSMILFFGAEFTRVYAMAHGRWVGPDDNAVKVTSEEKARQGIVSEGRMQSALCGQLNPRPQLLRLPPRCPDDGVGVKDYAFAAGGIILGAALGGLGLRYWLNDPKRHAARAHARAAIDERLNHVETRLGQVARAKADLAAVGLTERIARLNTEIRRAGLHVRARETGRPLWMVRLADWIGGRWSLP